MSRRLTSSALTCALLVGLTAALSGAVRAQEPADRREPRPPAIEGAGDARPDAALRAPAGFAAVDRAPRPDVHDWVDQDERLYDPARLREIRIEVESANWQALLDRNLRRGLDAPVRVNVDGRQLEEVGLRLKGNTSLSVDGPKKPFNLSIDAFRPGQELWGYDVVNLNNGWGDPTMQREAAAYRLLRDFMPIPQSAFAKVWVNDRYLGVYLMVEQIEKTFLDAWFGDSGLLIKADNPADTQLESSTLDYHGDLQAYRRGYELKRGYADEDTAFEALQTLTRALDAPVRQGGIADEDFEAAIREHLDVDAALWYLAANNVLLNYDSYYAGHNYYLHQEPAGRRFHLLNWDWNLSFATFHAWFGELITRNPVPFAETDPFDQAERPDRPLIRRLLSVPSYRADYAAHVRSLRDQVLAPAHLVAVARAGQDLIREAVREEREGIYEFEDFERGMDRDLLYHTPFGNRTVTTLIPGLSSTAEARHAFLSDPERMPELVAPALRLTEQGMQPAEPDREQAVLVRSRFEGSDRPSEVELRYRVDGGAELRLSMAVVEDEGQRFWQARIPPQAPGSRVSYVLRAQTADGRVVFAPAATLTEPYRYRVAGIRLPERPAGDLVINELMADNQGTLADAGGDFEDWVELYNRGDGPVDLAGYFLSDDPVLPWAFALPETTLQPGQHLLIWTDGAPEEGLDHAPFRLDKDGEQLLLSTREAVVDRVDYGPQLPDRSWGRATDGQVAWRPCDRPSPGQANDCRRVGWQAYLPRVELR